MLSDFSGRKVRRYNRITSLKNTEALCLPKQLTQNQELRTLGVEGISCISSANSINNQNCAFLGRKSGVLALHIATIKQLVHTFSKGNFCQRFIIPSIFPSKSIGLCLNINPYSAFLLLQFIGQLGRPGWQWVWEAKY